MPEISPIFNYPGAHFVLLPKDQKAPPETEWQKHPRSYEEACAHLGNVALAGGNGYIIIDFDNPEAFNGLTLTATTRWETRPSRQACMFACHDIEEGLKSIGKKRMLLKSYFPRPGSTSEK